MGERTVVVLNNDQVNEWANDPKLGEKIYRSAVIGMVQAPLEYGDVVECIHCDFQSLIVFDGLNGTMVADSQWYRNQTTEARNLALLKQWAELQGYRVVKKTKKKA